MKKLIVFILLAAMTGLFGGCASLSKNQCLHADWYEIGNRDGSLGKSRSLFESHYDACLEYGVHADRQAYFRGRTEGLQTFCTYENGFVRGKRDRPYRQVCPPELEADFLAGYEKGKRIHVYESKIAELEDRCEHIDRQIQKKEKKLYSADISDQQRIELLGDLRSLDRQYRQASFELKALQNNPPPD